MADLWAQRIKLQIELDRLRWDKELNIQKVKEVFAKKSESKIDMFLTNLDYFRKIKCVINQKQIKKLDAQWL